jgi:hypothetical protein
VALLVSLVALVTTVLQVLQQYFSSAEGYRRCTGSSPIAHSLCLSRLAPVDTNMHLHNSTTT